MSRVAHQPNRTLERSDHPPNTASEFMANLHALDSLSTNEEINDAVQLERFWDLQRTKVTVKTL